MSPAPDHHAPVRPESDALERMAQHTKCGLQIELRQDIIGT